MKTTVGHIANAIKVLPAVLQYKLPVKVSYRLHKFTKALEKEANIINEEVNKLKEKYGGGSLDEQGNWTLQIDTDTEGFVEEFNTLMDEEVELPDFELDLDQCTNVELSVYELDVLIDLGIIKGEPE